MTIEVVQMYFNAQKIVLSDHIRGRMQGKNISMFDIINGISTGEFIEDYPKAYPYPACLILGYTNNKPIHICIGIGSKSGIFITAYWPSLDKWECDYKTRKKK